MAKGQEPTHPLCGAKEGKENEGTAFKLTPIGQVRDMFFSRVKTPNIH